MKSFMGATILVKLAVPNTVPGKVGAISKYNIISERRMTDVSSRGPGIVLRYGMSSTDGRTYTEGNWSVEFDCGVKVALKSDRFDSE